MKEIELYHRSGLQEAFAAGVTHGSGYLNEAVHSPNYFEWIGQNKKRLSIPMDKKCFIHAVTQSQIMKNEGLRMITTSILETVISSVYNVTIDELRNSTRQIGRIMQARRAVYYMSYFHIHLTLKEIGEKWGGKGHATALNGARRLAGYASFPGRDLDKLKEVYSGLYMRGYNIFHYVQKNDVESKSGVYRKIVQPVEIDING